MKILPVVVLLACLGSFDLAVAEVITLPLAKADALSGAPVRGASMDDVRAGWGEPAEIVSAVGEPPISRWHYPEFTVYFEHQRVLHAAKRRLPE